MQISAPMGGGRVISYSEFNREFVGVPYGHPQNSNPNNPLPDSGYGHSETSVMRGAVVRSPSFSSQITRESARDQIMAAGYREEDSRGYSDRNREDRYGDSTSNLPPTYAESQSDVLSTRVLTPQYPQPSAFLNQNRSGSNSATQEGFLSPQHTGRGFDTSESPYSSQVFSPDSLRTSFLSTTMATTQQPITTTPIIKTRTFKFKIKNIHTIMTKHEEAAYPYPRV